MLQEQLTVYAFRYTVAAAQEHDRKQTQSPKKDRDTFNTKSSELRKPGQQLHKVAILVMHGKQPISISCNLDFVLGCTSQAVVRMHMMCSQVLPMQLGSAGIIHTCVDAITSKS